MCVQLLLNHVVHESLRIEDLLGDKNSRTVSTMAGRVLVAVHDGADTLITYADHQIARVLASDINAGGCVMHVVDAVLSPFPLAELPQRRTLEAEAQVRF